MADNTCLYHTDHENRIVKNERSITELDNRVTDLDKDHAVSKTEILGVLRNLEKLPETMAQISTTMVSMQGEIQSSNDRMGRLENKFNSLDTRISQVDEDGKFNIRKWIRDNWIGLSIGLAALIYFGSEFIKGLAK